MTDPRITPKERLDLIIGSVDWLLANPDNQAIGRMAYDDAGVPSSPFDPRASCFCLVGRLLHDGYEKGLMEGADRQTRPGDTIFVGLGMADAFLAPLNLSPYRLIQANDRTDFEERQAHLRDFRKAMVAQKASS